MSEVVFESLDVDLTELVAALGSVAPVEAAIARLIETARNAARVVDGERVELLLAETAERLESLTKETS